MIYESRKRPLTQNGLVEDYLDSQLAIGQCVASQTAIEHATGLSPIAIRRQLERLGDRVVRLPGRRSCYLIVSPEHRRRGCPPPADWLDEYFRIRGEPYYLGLLSAASAHGSSQQAVMRTQVIVGSPIRPLEIGDVRIEFHVKKSILGTPLTTIPGLNAPLLVSSVEATALDLMRYSKAAGGLAHAMHVLADLIPAFRILAFREALISEPEVAAKQRLGYALSLLDAPRLATEVANQLLSNAQRIAFVPGQPASKDSLRYPWQIYDNRDWE